MKETTAARTDKYFDGKVVGVSVSEAKDAGGNPLADASGARLYEVHIRALWSKRKLKWWRMTARMADRALPRWIQLALSYFEAYTIKFCEKWEDGYYKAHPEELDDLFGS